MNNLVICDFDHLLFRSEEFWQAILAFVARRFDIDPLKFDDERSDRTETGLGRVANGEGYNLFVHLAAYDIGHNEAREALLAELRGDRWLYDGAVELIEFFQARGYTVVIMSVGVVPFQIEIKRDCCSNLPRLPFRVVDRNKGVVLAEESPEGGELVYGGITYQVIIVIDDCGDTFDALGYRDGWFYFQVKDRPKYPKASSHDWVRKVTELEQIQPYVEAIDASLVSKPAR